MIIVGAIEHATELHDWVVSSPSYLGDSCPGGWLSRDFLVVLLSLFRQILG